MTVSFINVLHTRSAVTASNGKSSAYRLSLSKTSTFTGFLVDPY
jgi:hypothetical protein